MEPSKDQAAIGRMWELLRLVQEGFQVQASRELTIAALERCLCEVDKYFRVTIKGETPKRMKRYGPVPPATPPRRTVGGAPARSAAPTGKKRSRPKRRVESTEDEDAGHDPCCSAGGGAPAPCGSDPAASGCGSAEVALATDRSAAEASLKDGFRAALMAVVPYDRPPARRGCHATPQTREQEIATRQKRSASLRRQSQGCQIPTAAMKRLIGETLQGLMAADEESPPRAFKLRQDAVACVRAALEEFAVEVFGTGGRFAMHAKRNTLQPEDIIVFKDVIYEKKWRPPPGSAPNAAKRRKV